MLCVITVLLSDVSSNTRSQFCIVADLSLGERTRIHSVQLNPVSAPTVIGPGRGRLNTHCLKSVCVCVKAYVCVQLLMHFAKKKRQLK